MTTFAEMDFDTAEGYPSPNAIGMFQWTPYTPSTAADAYPARAPVGVIVPLDGDYELELLDDDDQLVTATVKLIAGAQYEIANLIRVRAGAASVILFHLKH